MIENGLKQYIYCLRKKGLKIMSIEEIGGILVPFFDIGAYIQTF